MAQSDYLNKTQLATRQKYQLKQDEQILKENFRRRLETHFQDGLLKKYPSTDVEEIRLRCYGSLNNGFGLAQCDMDLLLSLPAELDLINKAVDETQDGQSDAIIDPSQQQATSTTAPQSILSSESNDDRFEVALLLEGLLLDLGIGARLLTKTRVPILRVCERPSEELLTNLRNYRIECQEASSIAKEKSQDHVASTPPLLSVTEISTALQELTEEAAAAQIGLPASPPTTKQPSLEFSDGCGVQCDINFTNFVAIHNTRLLREYCLYDSRVAEVGTFVKAWAKIRDINTPYWGTLSSYGYVLMVLHYLMNVARPPVIPNLQSLAVAEGSWDSQPVEKFEGKYDIRFWNDPIKLQAYKAEQPRNRESTGHLLRGFFWYFSAREGFNFKNDIISIRTRGGILKKFHKGWTEAKWADQNKSVRQRYLLAIEDPFEIDHNIARVVGHNGIVAIRDEFRRAWSIISSIGGPDESAQNLLDPVEGRGDLLRKDQEHHREKMRKMKQELESKERQALKEASEELDPISDRASNEASNAVPSIGEMANNGTFSLEAKSPIPKPLRRRRHTKPQLTEDIGIAQVKTRQPRPDRVRRVKLDSDDEDESTSLDRAQQQGFETDRKQLNGHTIVGGKDRDDSGDAKREDDGTDEQISLPSEMHLSQGVDENGNPIAWDLSTQDGRWLLWRDNKIRRGKWRGPSNPSLAAYDQTHPFDPRRPISDDAHDLKIANELFYVNQAPYPMNKIPAITSTESAIAAGIEKPWHAKHKRDRRTKGRRRAKRDSSSSLDMPDSVRVLLNLETASNHPKTADNDGPGDDCWDTKGAAQSQSTGEWPRQRASPDRDQGHRAVKDNVESGNRGQDWQAAWTPTLHENYEASHGLEGWKDGGPGHVRRPSGPKAVSSLPETYWSVPIVGDWQHAIPEPTHEAAPWISGEPEENPDQASDASPENHHWQWRSNDDSVDHPIASARRGANLTVSYRNYHEQRYGRPYLSAKPRSQAFTSSVPLRSNHEPVGLPIGWDRTTAGGRWLCWRDSVLRLGLFDGPEGPHLKALHELYPYDSSMPVWKLHIYNAELRAHYQDSLEATDVETSNYPATQYGFIHSARCEDRVAEPVRDRQPILEVEHKPWPQYSLSELPPATSEALRFASSLQPTVDKDSKKKSQPSQSDTTEETPDTAFIRSRRLAYFAERELQDQEAGRVRVDEEVKDITMFMQQAGIGHRVAQLKSFNEASDRRVIDSHQTKIMKGMMSATQAMQPAAQQSFSSSSESKGETDITEHEPPTTCQQAVKVPPTPLSNVTGRARPQDGDTQIMPIPPELGFKFDVRQLRDLAVIKEGGNGCAIAGCEFELDDGDVGTDNGAFEWDRPDLLDGRVGGQELPYEYGRGDEEGLLAELPGINA